MLLGNDLFNPEVIETLGQHEHRSLMTIRHGNQVDCLPYQQMSTEERSKREKLFSPLTSAEAVQTDYEKTIELMMGNPTSRVGYIQHLPDAELHDICEEAAKEVELQGICEVADDQRGGNCQEAAAINDDEFFDELAKRAADEAMQSSFL